MSTLLYPTALPPVSTEPTRVTADPIPDNRGTMPSGPPEFGQRTADPNPHTGLDTRYAPSYLEPSVQSAPGQPINDSGVDVDADVKNRQETSGDSSRRELAGKRGHGTYPLSIGIEPEYDVESDTYFAAPYRPAGADGTEYVAPALDADREVAAVGQATATKQSRAATQASLLSAYIGSTA